MEVLAYGPEYGNGVSGQLNGGEGDTGLVRGLIGLARSAISIEQGLK